ncbi:MAG TPA: RHS repeat-associated core domain-containing protein [Candidatus Angelobacter sp.]|nr:RHS repeat-associated core domain-containing protein [Candidatus Angelobacter sp.]
MTRAQRYLLFILSFAFSATYTAAQVQTGTPAFASFGGSPEAINLGNLNAHWTFPILHKPGRGMNFNYDLGYDSSVWYPVGASGSQVWTPLWNWGWLGQTQVATGYVWYSWSQGRCNTGTKGNPNWVYYDRYHYLSYSDKFGRGYWIGAWVDDNDGTCPYQDPYSATVSLGAGSGYSIYVDAYLTVTVYPSKGGTITPPLQSGNGSGSGNDRNGNIISVSGGVFTDTLGTTALTIAGVGTPSSPVTFTYPAPSGANASYTMKYTAFTVQTNFHCSGVTEYTGTNIDLPSEIDLPDGTKYTLTYETTPNDAHNPHYVTGRLASVGLPTGGTISYSYSGGGTGVNGITCADGSAATITRTTPDGAWTYARSQVSGTHWQTKVTTPPDSQNQGSVGDDTVIDFQQDSASNYYETQRLAYQGSSSSGTLLRTTTICYNTNTTNCSTTAVSSPITQRNVTTILPGSANLQAQSIYKYNSNGSLTEQDDYDYGSGASGSLLKKTAMTFASLGSITSFRQQVTVTNGSGATVAQTSYNYDETAVVATTGTPQHTSVSGSRGNLTSINSYTNGTTYLTKRMTYFDTGVVQTITDLNNAQITYNFHDATSTCGNAFPTSVTEPLSLSKSMTWNCNGGVKLTSVDENNQTTTAAFSDQYFWRPASVTDPTSAAANITYTGQTQVEASLSFNSGNSALDPLLTRDGLGRPHVSQVREAPGSTNFDSTETDYDDFGRVARVTLPYVGTLGQTNSSAPAQTKTYDALNRTLSLSDNSGGSRTFSYTQNDVYVTRGPAPTGESSKRRQEEFDAFGRLTSVCEITSTSGSGTCGQQTSQTGFWTKYAYDALGRLTGVTQNAQSSNSQTRTYVYDLLGRLTSETNPEAGTTTYVYDTDTTCGTSSGDRVKKTDAVGNVTCTAYDALHRPTAITYPSGSYASVTPAKHFVYDSATVNSVAMTYAKGRLAEAYTCTGSCTTKLTDEGFSYTVRGQPSDVYQSTPNSSGYYHVSSQYWANSALKQLTAPGIPTITYTTDGEGRPYQVSASSGQNPVTNAVFNAASLPTSVTYGSTDNDSFTFDSNTNRITQYKFTVNSQSLIGSLTWNANHTLASQNITDPFYSADAQNCSYTHDDLTRLASVNCGASTWQQNFSYDAFGNITKTVPTGGTGNSFQPTYSSSTNHYATLPGFTPSYDANGNVLADGSHTYSMDSAGKPVTVDSVNLTYDALGRMVEQNRSGSYTQILYSPGGAKLGLMNGQTLQKAFVQLPGGGVAVYNSSGLLYYGHSDHLGSIKLGSTPSRTMYFDLAYAPFGEVYATTGTTDPTLTGQRQDTVAGLFDFPAREYSTQGRWPHPDPSGLASVNLSDPQTLNRYAYVRNNPLVMIDPQGLGDDVPGCEEDGEEVDDCHSEGDSGGGGSSAGGESGNTCNNSDTDPTCGGDPNNGGTDCPSGSADCQNPTTVQTCISIEGVQQSCNNSPYDNSLQGSLLAQMTPQDLQVFSSALDWVDLGVGWDTLGVSVVLGAPAAVTATSYVLNVLPYSPIIAQLANDFATGYQEQQGAPGTPSNLVQWAGYIWNIIDDFFGN